jgi:5-methylcytosine-specific restriction endonuclease McrA
MGTSKANSRGWGKSGDPEKAKVRAYEWRDRNPEKLRFIQWANNSNMQKEVPGRASYRDLMAIMADQAGKCRYCQADAEEMDHILPTKSGGSNWPWNLQFLCFPCNRRKAKRHPLQFETDEGFIGGQWLFLLKPSKITRSSTKICEGI